MTGIVEDGGEMLVLSLTCCYVRARLEPSRLDAGTVCIGSWASSPLRARAIEFVELSRRPLPLRTFSLKECRFTPGPFV